MNALTLLYNRVCFVLEKGGDVQPFSGAVVLVSILMCTVFMNIVLFAYSFIHEAFFFQWLWLYLVVWIVFVPSYFYARRNREQIVDTSIRVPYFKNVLVIAFCVTVVSVFILLANINREKNSVPRKNTPSIGKEVRPSLEGKIRKWLE